MLFVLLLWPHCTIIDILRCFYSFAKICWSNLHLPEFILTSTWTLIFASKIWEEAHKILSSESNGQDECTSFTTPPPPLWAYFLSAHWTPPFTASGPHLLNVQPLSAPSHSPHSHIGDCWQHFQVHFCTSVTFKWNVLLDLSREAATKMFGSLEAKLLLQILC